MSVHPTMEPSGRWGYLGRELWYSFQFLCIAFIAATIGAFSWAIQPGEDINFPGMLPRLVRDFYGPWLITFLGLSLLRVLVLRVFRGRNTSMHG